MSVSAVHLEKSIHPEPIVLPETCKAEKPPYVIHINIQMPDTNKASDLKEKVSKKFSELSVVGKIKRIARVVFVAIMGIFAIITQNYLPFFVGCIVLNMLSEIAEGKSLIFKPGTSSFSFSSK